MQTFKKGDYVYYDNISFIYKVVKVTCDGITKIRTAYSLLDGLAVAHEGTIQTNENLWWTQSLFRPISLEHYLCILKGKKRGPKWISPKCLK